MGRNVVFDLDGNWTYEGLQVRVGYEEIKMEICD